MQAVLIIQLSVQLLQFYFQMLPQILRQLHDVTTVHEFIGRLPVGVCSLD